MRTLTPGPDTSGPDTSARSRGGDRGAECRIAASAPDAVRARVAAVLDLDAGLPAPVFRELADEAVFCEFDLLLAPDARPAPDWRPTGARGPVGLHGDRQIDLLVVEAGALGRPPGTVAVRRGRAGRLLGGAGFHSGRERARTVELTGPGEGSSVRRAAGRWVGTGS
ncbi:hypothetical protein ACIPYS_23890 [Kitasatospora sp. NPDC089913]|uniref:hypothetical protein n=1 Tax=Kitasatospora sp. NPDC089913 TaxID=3364080 RepID=UPI003815BD18